jgi:hypothetical protein
VLRASHIALRTQQHGLIHLLKTGKMRFAKVQDAMRDGYEVSERGWREGSRKGKFPSLARKRQQAYTYRLLHMLTAPENELIIVLNKEATELELMEQTLEAYLEEKSERRSSKKKRREMEGRVQSGGRAEGRKRRKFGRCACV